MAFFPPHFMLPSPSPDYQHDDSHPPPPSLSSRLPSSCNPHQDFHGVGPGGGGGGTAPMLGKRSSHYKGILSSFPGMDPCQEQTHHPHPNNNGREEEEEEEELSEDGSQQLGGGGGEKKRRLNREQVKTLEKNFELGDKLEPERKLQLAKALGLQPRQIAIWFQNRRARWKTKQLEKDYNLLKSQWEALKADNDSLLSQNHKLQDQIMALKNRQPTESINLNKETQGSSSNRSDNSSDINLDISRTLTTTTDSPLLDLSAHPPTNSAADGHTFFPSSSNRTNGPPVAQLLFQSPPPPSDVKEETFTSMLCGMEDQTGFWPWLEQQHFN